MSTLDKFLDDLQEQIFDETKEAFGEKGFDRWRNPKFAGKMENPQAHGRVVGTCGDTMEIFFKFENDRVKEGSYTTDGCGSSSVSGSFAVELSLGKSPDELADITGNDVLNAIGRLPESEQHCASLAALTIQDALTNFMNAGK